MALRLTAIAVGASHGLTATIAAIVAAQVVATVVDRRRRLRRVPALPARASVPLGEERRDILSFVVLVERCDRL